jgi:hypothetical protein
LQKNRFDDLRLLDSVDEMSEEMSASAPFAADEGSSRFGLGCCCMIDPDRL